MHDFKRKLPITLEIVVLSFSMTTIFGITGGIISARSQNSAADYGMRLLAVAGLSIPNFLLLTLLLVIPARLWGYAPPFSSVHFFDDPVSNLELILPATALLAISSSAGLMRLTRSAFLEVFRQDYMRTARAKGLTENAVTFRHGFRNALPPVLTLTGLQLGNLLGGSVILETIMGLPGLGTWFLSAISFNDYPIVMVSALYTAFTLMMISLAIDVAYAWLDPRIRYN
jgi:peptide/nickel transport system permease protein